jgi:hypothetical protein
MTEPTGPVAAPDAAPDAANTHALPEVSESFDAEALRRRYAEERERRLRRDGNQQYVEPTGDHEHYLDDPWADPAFSSARWRCWWSAAVLAACWPPRGCARPAWTTW